MFFTGWIAFIAIGLGASLLVFFWALRTGQFSEHEQERARYLPLNDEFPLPRMENSSSLSIEVYALFLILGIGLTALVSTLVLTFLHGNG